MHTQMLAQLPEPGFYYHPAKILVFAAGLNIWWYVWAWVAKDAKKVKINPLGWVLGIGAAGSFGALFWLMLPSYALGISLFTMLFGGTSLVYVLVRNKRCSPSQSILTPNHLARILKKKPPSEDAATSKDRVRIKDSNGKPPVWPTDPTQNEAFAEMQELLFDAMWRRANQVEVNLTGQQARVLYKVDGVVRERDPLLRPLADHVMAHLKRMAGMEPEELRRPQEGHFTASIGAGGAGDRKAELLLKSSGSTAGHRLAIQIVAEESRYKLPDLGLTRQQLAQVEPLVDEKKGLILVCGPKENGITSAQYAIVRGHDAFLWNIQMIETQKLMEVENVTQHLHDGKDGQVSFARQLQSVFRTDPDIVMVGACPDRDTAVLCAEYAQNKKVYMALAANDAFDGLRKYIEYIGDHQLAARSLLAVIACRLVRILCTNCRKGYRPDVAVLKKANLPLDQNRPFYRPPNDSEVEVDRQGNPVLCPVCQGSGYVGRTGIYEVLIVDDAMRALITGNGPVQAVKTQARKAQMANLQEAGLQKVYEGITSMKEILRVISDDEKSAGK